MTRFNFVILHNCRYCGQTGTHSKETPCPYAQGFRDGFNAGVEDAAMRTDTAIVDNLIQEVDGNG